MQSLPSVYELTLQHNPWRCDCGLRSFRNWMVERLIPLSYSPNCSTPQRLFGKSWSQLELEEFACPPDVVSVDTEVVVYEGKKKISYKFLNLILSNQLIGGKTVVKFRPIHDRFHHHYSESLKFH